MNYSITWAEFAELFLRAATQKGKRIKRLILWRHVLPTLCVANSSIDVTSHFTAKATPLDNLHLDNYIYTATETQRIRPLVL